MELAATSINDTLTVSVLESRIDAVSSIRFRDRMREILMHPAPHVVLDLSRVDFLDSSGLGALVAVWKMCAGNRRLELYGITPNVGRVFRLTRMDAVFTVIDTPPAGFREAG
jgi:anti-sigma B factor antagonist